MQPICNIIEYALIYFNLFLYKTFVFFLHRYLNHIQIDEKILPGCRVAQIGVGIYELTIEQVQPSHAGFLECRVWNIYESISETWELIVSGTCRILK